jgi:hypothetical protein
LTNVFRGEESLRGKDAPFRARGSSGDGRRDHHREEWRSDGELVPLEKGIAKRRPGGWKGQIWIADDFDAPLPDDLLDLLLPATGS